MNALAPIPTPPALRWREFRHQGIPVLVFSICVLAVVYLWRNHVASATLVGEAEAVRAQVTSPQAGTLTELKVIRFQTVSMGDAIAVVRPTDPRIQLALLQSEVDLLRIRSEPEISELRDTIDYERLRLEWLLQKVQLASTRVALERAENQVKRDAELLRQQILTEDLFDASEKNRDQLRVEVDERSRLISDLQETIDRYESLRSEATPKSMSVEMLAEFSRIQARLEAVEAKMDPIFLVAPISGMVSSVYREAGEHVTDGEPIVTVSALETGRIVGYLRQPVPIAPEAGMSVHVRTRSGRRQGAEAHIRHVGAQFEIITNSLAILRPGMLQDVGLPIEVSIPRELGLRPGEVVDLIISPR